MQTKHVSTAECSELLQLPEPVVDLVLQKLDPCSLACAAVTCSRLSTAVPAHNSQLAVRCSSPDSFQGLLSWLDKQSTSLTNVTNCSIDKCFSDTAAGIEPQAESWLRLPFLHLCELDLKGVTVQLEPSHSSPGVLQQCPSLVTLSLKDCTVQDAGAAFAAISALPQLRSLSLTETRDTTGRHVFGDLHKLAHLTKLWLGEGQAKASEETLQLSQLSALENLANLKLSGLPVNAVPGGLPSQLVWLTALDFRYETGYGAQEQFRNLSCLTALQDLKVTHKGHMFDLLTDKLTGIDHLSQLTSLQLMSTRLEFITETTRSWTRLAALDTLVLYLCRVQPAAIASFTQVRALYLMGVAVTGSLGELLLAVSQLTQLTQLCFRGPRDSLRPRSADALRLPPPPPAAFTALTASTNLRVLELSCWMECKELRQGCVLFRIGTTYPNLRHIDLSPDPDIRPGHHRRKSEALLINRHHLKQLCISCPAIESLAFALCRTSSQTAFLPLLQLSALTDLRVQYAGERCAVAAVVKVVARLTGLKQLALKCLSQLKDPALLQLTALTALRQLTLATRWTPEYRVCFTSKVRWFNPPDVWLQLLRHLLPDPAAASPPA